MRSTYGHLFFFSFFFSGANLTSFVDAFIATHNDPLTTEPDQEMVVSPTSPPSHSLDPSLAREPSSGVPPSHLRLRTPPVLRPPVHTPPEIFPSPDTTQTSQMSSLNHYDSMARTAPAVSAVSTPILKRKRLLLECVLVPNVGDILGANAGIRRVTRSTTNRRASVTME